MKTLVFCLLLLNISISGYCYLRLFKRRVLFDKRFGMTVSMTSSMTITVVLSIFLSFIIPFQITYLTIFLTSLGCLIGILFGLMDRFQAVSASMFGGVLGGIMGSMLGSVVKDPTLCGLPKGAEESLVQNMVSFSILATIIMVLSVWLILYSIRV
jgi:hypothetical protein